MKNICRFLFLSAFCLACSPALASEADLICLICLTVLNYSAGP